MQTYGKIETLFDRDKQSFKVIEGAYRRPIFGTISHWRVTEKIDGTNIRIHFVRDPFIEATVRVGAGVTMLLGGRTDKADLPKPLTDHLHSREIEWRAAADILMREHDLGEITLFGEGYGARIQKGGGRYRDDQSFILFDVLAGSRWLDEDQITANAEHFGVERVPILEQVLTTAQCVELARSGFCSTIAKDTEYLAEGIVMRPIEPLYDRRGERIIAKLKQKDFG